MSDTSNEIGGGARDRSDPTGPQVTQARKNRIPISRSALTTRTSLSIPPKIPLDEWSRIGNHIQIISNSSAWWLGDWLIYGQAQYPDRYKIAINETSLDYQTLRNYAWVARQFSVVRRRDKLSFQHHAELASLPEAEQDEWLARAERFGWSRNELRNRVKASRKVAAKPKKKTDEVLNIEMSVPNDQRKRWLEAATVAQQDLLSWIVDILDSAATTMLESRNEFSALENAQ